MPRKKKVRWPVLESFSTAVVSTFHITRDDARILEVVAADKKPLIVESVDYRWRVYISPDDFVDHDYPIWEELGTSREFRDLVALAHGQGARWIEFDQDGEIYKGLPKFDW